MSVYDCCMFLNELDMLEARFNILDPVVDYFVVCEANETHSGKKRPFCLPSNMDRFKPFFNKLIYVPVYGLSAPGRGSWDRERYQRSRIAEGLKLALPSDFVIVGDCDEIVHPDAVQQFKQSGQDAAIFEMNMYYYNLTTRVDMGWGIGIMRHGMELDPNRIRTGQGRTLAHIPHGGWHFSYFGGAQAIVEKVDAFMHHADPVIADMPRNANFVQNKIDDMSDLFGRDLRLYYESLNESLPRYVLDHLDKYQGWLT